MQGPFDFHAGGSMLETGVHIRLQTMCEVEEYACVLLQSIPPRLFPKIPAKLLRDSSPYGALYSIAVKCYEITKQRNLKKIDFANPAKRKEASCYPMSALYLSPQDRHAQDMLAVLSA